MSEGFVPNLDFSEFKGERHDWTDEEVQQAIDATQSKFMGIGVHDVKITGIKKDSAKICKTDPQWAQIGLIIENASKEQVQHTMLFPLTRRIAFTTKSGKETPFTFGTFASFCKALGIKPGVLVHHLVSTNLAGSADMIGFGLRCIIKWSSKKVHPEYDENSSAWYIHDAKGARVCEEPFALPEADPNKSNAENQAERYAEMEAYCREHGMILELYPNKDFKQNMEINNVLGGAKKKPKITKVEVDDEDEDEEEIEDDEVEEEEEEEDTPPPVKTKKKKKKEPLLKKKKKDKLPEPEEVDVDEDDIDDDDEDDE